MEPKQSECPESSVDPVRLAAGQGLACCMISLEHGMHSIVKWRLCFRSMGDTVSRNKHDCGAGGRRARHIRRERGYSLVILEGNEDIPL